MDLSEQLTGSNCELLIEATADLKFLDWHGSSPGEFGKLFLVTCELTPRPGRRWVSYIFFV